MLQKRQDPTLYVNQIQEKYLIDFIDSNINTTQP